MNAGSNREGHKHKPDGGVGGGKNIGRSVSTGAVTYGTKPQAEQNKKEKRNVRRRRNLGTFSKSRRMGEETGHGLQTLAGAEQVGGEEGS
jgi:hypothetical protein